MYEISKFRYKLYNLDSKLEILGTQWNMVPTMKFSQLPVAPVVGHLNKVTVAMPDAHRGRKIAVATHDSHRDRNQRQPSFSGQGK